MRRQSMLGYDHTFIFTSYQARRPRKILLVLHVPASVAQLDARPTGDQEVEDSIPAGSGNIFSCD